MSEFLYCLNTSTIQPTPLLEKVRIAGQAGYSALEPWNVEIDEYLAAGGTLADLRSALSDAGLRVVSMIALGGWATPDPAALGAALEECRRRMAQAASLGSPFIVASPPDEAVDLSLAGDRFAELLRIGREEGVRPSMEFLGFVAGVKDLASALAIARHAGDPSATVVADVYHLLRGGGSLDDLLTIRGDDLAIFHINDLPASPPIPVQTDADRVMLGDGTVDLPGVISRLRTIGYRGPLSLELFNPSLWARDPLEVAKLGLDRLRRLTEA